MKRHELFERMQHAKNVRYYAPAKQTLTSYQKRKHKERKKRQKAQNEEGVSACLNIAILIEVGATQTDAQDSRR